VASNKGVDKHVSEDVAVLESCSEYFVVLCIAIDIPIIDRIDVDVARYPGAKLFSL